MIPRRMKFALSALLLISVEVVIAIPLAKTVESKYAAELPTKERVDSIIKTQASLLAESQAKVDIPFIPGVSWFIPKGGYPIQAYVNTFGTIDADFLRTHAVVGDDNSLLPMLVAEYLLEASFLFDDSTNTSDLLSLNEDTFISIIDLVEKFHKDRNRPNTSAVAFWRLKYNETSGLWYIYPQNFRKFCPYVLRGGDLLNAMFDLTSFKIPDNYQAILNMSLYLGGYLKLPADFDTTLNYIALEPLLRKSKYQKSHEAWIKNNPNPMSVMELLSKYAYRPFSDDQNKNMIAPHTFFALRKFLWDLEAHRRTDVALPPVFMYNYDDTFGDRSYAFNQFLYSGYVDVSVVGNIIYGVTLAVLGDMNNPDEWFNDDVQGIYRDTVDLMAYMLYNNFTDRRDLLLPGYPPIAMAVFFMTRCLKHLTAEETLPYPVLETAKETLANALRTNGTNMLLQSSHREWDGLIYFDDFLGNGDVDITGKPIQRREDRIFLTATAVNALINIWTEQGKFISTMSEDLKITISLAAQWLIKNIDNDEYTLYNCFGGYTGLLYGNYAWSFPHNYNSWPNKTNVSSDFVLRTQAELFTLHASVKGMISEEEYKKMLHEKYFGSVPYRDFQGLNSPKDGHYLCWNSIPVTRMSVVLAMANYRRYYL